MAERNFIPVNPKSVNSSEAISFGTYKDGSEWKSTGDKGIFRITADFGSGTLRFSGAPKAADGASVTFYDSFNLNSEHTYLEPNMGFFRPVIRIGTPGVKTGFLIENTHNEHLIICRGFVWLYFDATEPLEVGFKVYLTKSVANLRKDRAFITPFDPSTIIYGRRTLGLLVPYETWTDTSSKHPTLRQYQTVYVMKISNTEFMIGGAVGEHRKV